MSFFKSFFKFFAMNKNQMDDIKPLTEYLKNNDQFKKTSMKIYHTTEKTKSSLYSKLDRLLEEEDQLKFIEDESKKKKH